MADRHGKFLGGGLGQLGASSLAHFRLAGQDGDNPVFADVNTGCHIAGLPAAASSAAALGQRGAGTDGNQESSAERLDKPAPANTKVVSNFLAQLLQTDGGRIDVVFAGVR